MAIPFIVGPTLRELLHIFNRCLNQVERVQVNESPQIHVLNLSDRDVLSAARFTFGRPLGFEWRVRRCDVLEVLSEEGKDQFASLSVRARPDSVEQVQFMPYSGVNGDHGYSSSRGDKLYFRVLAQHLPTAKVVLQRIVEEPGSAWFAELPSLWEDCRR